MVIVGIGRLVLLCLPKTSHYFHSTLHWCVALLYTPKTSHNFQNFFLENSHSVNIVSQDWEFWITDIGKLHIQEWCIRYNNTSFTWVIFLGLEEINDNCRKMAYVEMMDRGFTDMLRVTKRRTFKSTHTNVSLSSCYGFHWLWHDKASVVK